MTRTGVDDPWRDGDGPDEAAWTRAGFTAAQADGFRRWRIGLVAARAWRRAGVTDGLAAVQWGLAGVAPDAVGAWQAAGVGPPEAIRWHEMGFDLSAVEEARRRGLTPETAHGVVSASRTAALHARGVRPRSPGFRRFADAGVPLDIVRGYLIRNWADDEAVSWAKSGIEAADALLWKTLGLSQREAERQVEAGVRSADAVRDWWRAGVPFDEVAAWIGAGLSPREAADQRARGVTAEQAAALRALRDDED